MPWVLIWRTGAPLAARRRASLSVSRSPTSAATRAPRAELPQRPLQKGRLARPRAGNQIQHKHSGRRVARPQARRQLVVLLQNSPPQLNNPGRHGFTSPSSISMESISSSRPWRISPHGWPQRGQRKLCTPSNSTSCPQGSQCTTTGSTSTTSARLPAAFPRPQCPSRTPATPPPPRPEPPRAAAPLSTRAPGWRPAIRSPTQRHSSQWKVRA
jgi:hypothetical protein